MDDTSLTRPGMRIGRGVRTPLTVGKMEKRKKTRMDNDDDNDEWEFCATTSFRWVIIECKTETTSVLVVKCFNPNMPLSCCRQIIVAVPPMKPVIVECERKSTTIPSLHVHTIITNKINVFWLLVRPWQKKKLFPFLCLLYIKWSF